MLRCPEIWSLNPHERDKLCQGIENGSNEFNQILDNVCAYVEGLPPKAQSNIPAAAVWNGGNLFNDQPLQMGGSFDKLDL
jgi:hypothetical protein